MLYITVPYGAKCDPRHRNAKDICNHLAAQKSKQNHKPPNKAYPYRRKETTEKDEAVGIEMNEAVRQIVKLS